MPLPILELPDGVLHKILRIAILDRGLSRCLRLRLVCKVFSKKFQSALFATRLLDDSNTFRHWRDYSHHDWADKLHHDLSRERVGRSRHQPVDESIYSHLGETAEMYRQVTDTQISLAEIIDALCRMMLMPQSYQDWKGTGATSPLIPDLSNSQSSLELLCLAGYLNDVKSAERLLHEYCLFPWYSYELFESPIYLAAYAGNTATFNLFMKYAMEPAVLDGLNRRSIVEFDDPDQSHTALQLIRSERRDGKAFEEAVYGACKGGSLDMLKLALNFLKEQGIDLGSLSSNDREYADGHTVCQRLTNSVEIYKHIDSLRKGPVPSYTRFHRQPKQPTLIYILKHHCVRGNTEIIQHMLDQGLDLSEETNFDRVCSPLVEACFAGYEDVVGILIEKGADPNQRCYRKHKLLPYTPLHAAAEVGSLAIVRKLLDHGAVVSGDAIHAALMAEHTSMVHLLLQICRHVEKEWRRKILHDVIDGGLQSMEALVRQAYQLLYPPCGLD